MKIKDFIKDFNKLNTEEDRVNFVKQIITVDYVPFVEKVDSCLKVLNDTWYVKDEITGEKRLHITSSATYVLYTMVLINKYTDLDVDFKNTIAQYDLLNNGNYLGVILHYIPENELLEFRRILEMTQDDVMQNEYHIGKYISDRIDSISTSLGATLVPAIEEFSKFVANMDEEKAKSIINVLDNSNIMKTLKGFMKR